MCARAHAHTNNPSSPLSRPIQPHEWSITLKTISPNGHTANEYTRRKRFLLIWRHVLFQLPVTKTVTVTAYTLVQLTQLNTGLQIMKYCANAWSSMSEDQTGLLPCLQKGIYSWYSKKPTSINKETGCWYHVYNKVHVRQMYANITFF